MTANPAWHAIVGDGFGTKRPPVQVRPPGGDASPYEPRRLGTRGLGPARGRKPAQGSCRDEVAAALSTLSARDGRSVFTVRDVYDEMVTAGTPYAETTVFKTMQRMKGAPKRPPMIQLERAGEKGSESPILTDRSPAAW